MGGCRCTFRDCSNNTVNSPGKHFFHFPYKDNERCKKWALNSDKTSFLSLPWTQLRNKTICEDHFIDACFMNFKRERLVKTAVPTLHRTKTGGFVDIKVDDTKLETLDYCFNFKGSNQHIIDLPSEQQPQQLRMQKRVILVNLPVDENPCNDEETIVDTNAVSDSFTPSTQAMQQNYKTSIDSKPVVLNRICPKRVKRIDMRNAPKEKLTISPKQMELVNDDIETTHIPLKRIKSELDNKKVVTIGGRKYGNVATTVATVSTNADPRYGSSVMETSGDTSPITDNSLNDSITANILEKINHIEERDANKVDKSLYLQMMEKQAKQIEDLKLLLTEKLADKKSPESETNDDLGGATAAAASAGTRFVRVEKGPAMTKVQLFNGIRKYLNPTMVALLRMEMFGSAEREYRPDERQLSKELYNLNQNVYDYMRDEWRFRLPSKTDVEQWLKDADNDETWELC